MSYNQYQYFRINLTLGPMFSGKTSRAISLYNLYDSKEVLICCPSKNTRDNGKTLKSHDNIEIDVLFFNSILDILEKINDDIKYIIIDEVQFISNLKDLCFSLNIHKVLTVYLFGLNSDYNQKLFPPIIDILPYINDRITFLKSKCSKCKVLKCAEFSQLKDLNLENKKTVDGIIIGGKDEYEVLCYSCFIINKIQF